MTLLFLLACSTDPDAPPSVRYDLDACTECGMLVSDPAYAAALVTQDGRTLPFDDPGCLFHHVMDEAPSVRAMWFHHGAGDRWLRQTEAAFTPGTTSPMGSGLLPVPAGTPGAIGVGEASSHVLSGKRP